ncbi:hypothetical protein [Bifidobacterium sp. SO1]|uniref:hypothetical protein n=1 Tax=Bifidobacterium sp. SO1 TaxID=2809029 RepID=UPI001BDDBB4C|nr:hypothetical protein [Bifidobacterium sp. SO1]MBT1162203.1 hypothetical protein [Bifidobacterium sp. SO1]
MTANITASYRKAQLPRDCGLDHWRRKEIENLLVKYHETRAELAELVDYDCEGDNSSYYDEIDELRSKINELLRKYNLPELDY